MKDIIRITRTLLEKPVEELSDKERSAVEDFNETTELHRKWLDEENAKISRDCKILCSGSDRYPIPDYGWTQPVKRLCYALENLNYDFRKCGVRVVLDQSKEKYGTLRFYTHFDTWEIGLFGLILKPLDKFVDCLSKLDFGRKVVVDKPEYKTVEWRELTKEQFDSRTNEIGIKFFDKYGIKVEVVGSRKEVADPNMLTEKVYLVEEDGKFYYSYVLYHTAKTHVEFTRHRILGKLMDLTRRLSIFLDRFYKEPRIQSIKIQEMDYRVDELVRTAEEECMKRCQHCGIEFGNYYNRCETQGWYMYVCQRCADTLGSEYVMNNKHYIEGVEIDDKTPEEKPSVKEDEE